MKNTELLRNHYIKLLGAIIKNNAGPECNTADDIFSNLRYLAKDKVEFGDVKTSWLEINTKKMLAMIIDPDYRMEFNVIEKTKTELTIEAKLYWSETDYPAGIGFVKRSLEQMVSNSTDYQKSEIEFEALVRGAAATRAFTDAGIGLEFYNDQFDSLFSEIESKEAEQVTERKKEAAQQEFEKKVPAIPSAEELKANAIKRSNSKKAKEAKETEEACQQETIQPAPAEEPVNASTTAPLSIDEAKMVKVDMGMYKGQPLGLVAEANMRNLIWLIKNGSEVSDAAKLIVEDDGRLVNYL